MYTRIVLKSFLYRVFLALHGLVTWEMSLWMLAGVCHVHYRRGRGDWGGRGDGRTYMVWGWGACMLDKLQIGVKKTNSGDIYRLALLF